VLDAPLGEEGLHLLRQERAGPVRGEQDRGEGIDRLDRITGQWGWV